MIDREDDLPLKRQCAMLDLSRSVIYYTPVLVNERDMALMKEMDKIHTDFPFYGSR